MFEYIVSHYGLFLLKVITVLIGLAVLIAIISKSKNTSEKGSIKITNLSEKFESEKLDLQLELLNDEDYKKLEKEKKKEEKNKERVEKPKLFVLSFDGNVMADEVEELRQEITAILSVAKADDEVLLKLESPGGTINGYGLAASQLKRLKAHHIKLTVAVDRMAASGGYMMACVADKIVAAPFSYIGSIGVVAEFPNFYRLLKRYDVDYEVMTAGEYKRTITLAGENTEKGKQKFQEELEEAHVFFKQFVSENRPQLDIDTVATGEHWFGQKALELQLIDDIATSDDLILKAYDTKEVFEIKYEEKKSMIQNIGIQAEKAFQNVVLKLLHTNRKNIMK